MSFPQILSGPDISNWAETARITSVEFRPDNFLVRHTKETGPGAWLEVHIPGWSATAEDPGAIQWTLWIVFDVNGQLVTGGCIEFWPDPALGVNRGEPAPFSDGARNWWYQIAGMAGHQPGTNDLIGVMAVAGDQRSKDIRSVEERSNICWVRVPPNDTGAYEFAAPIPVAVAPVETVPFVPAPLTLVPQVPTPVTPVPSTPIPSLGSVQVAQLLNSVLTAFKAINTKLDNCATHAEIASAQAEIAKQGQALVTILTPITAPAPAHTDATTAIDTLSSLAKLFKK